MRLSRCLPESYSQWLIATDKFVNLEGTIIWQAQLNLPNYVASNSEKPSWCMFLRAWNINSHIKSSTFLYYLNENTFQVLHPRKQNKMMSIWQIYIVNLEFAPKKIGGKKANLTNEILKETKVPEDPYCFLSHC